MAHTVHKSSVSSDIVIRPTGVRTSVLTLRSETSGNPLTIQNSALAVVCTIDNIGNITCGTNAVLATAIGYTQSQIDKKKCKRIRN